MCGLVGVMGTINHREKQTFKWLLHFDATRGEHSTGVLAVSPDNQTHVFKELGTAPFLYNKFAKEFPKGVYEAPAKILMGHNRFATQGEIIAQNAHPFEFENVIGAHNGTCQEWTTRSLFMADKFQIDSQKLYSQLNHDADVQKLWSHLEDSQTSAASLTFWDKRDNSMNFVRNSQRPMYFALSKDSNTLFWASEQWMLQIACGQTGVQVQGVEATEVNHHYKFFLKDGKLVLNKKAVEAKKYVPLYTTVGNGFGRNSGDAKRYLDIRVDFIVKDNVLNPYVAMTDITSTPNRDIICIPPEVEREQVFKLLQEFGTLHKKIFEGEPSFRMNEEWLFTGPDQKTLRLGAYRLIRELTNEIDILQWELNNNSSGYEEVPDHSVAEDAKGNPIKGRALKRALKAANNCCSLCGTTNLKKGDINVVHGGIFLNEKEFVCGECVADNNVYQLMQKH